MRPIENALNSLKIAKLGIESAIDALETAEEAAFDVFNIITSAEYGKQRFFKEKNGLIYDRAKSEYLEDFNAALSRYVKEVSGDAE